MIFFADNIAQNPAKLAKNEPGNSFLNKVSEKNICFLIKYFIFFAGILRENYKIIYGWEKIL